MEMADLMGRDNKTFTINDAYNYADNLWSRYFDRIYPMAPFNKTFMDKMMLMKADFFNSTLVSGKKVK